MGSRHTATLFLSLLSLCLLKSTDISLSFTATLFLSLLPALPPEGTDVSLSFTATLFLSLLPLCLSNAPISGPA
ncbi:MAG: hypothetical protein R2758_08975 [Bacteroidales bacterium]